MAHEYLTATIDKFDQEQKNTSKIASRSLSESYEARATEKRYKKTWIDVLQWIYYSNKKGPFKEWYMRSLTGKQGF